MRDTIARVLSLLLCALAAVPLAVRAQDWEKQWNAWVAAAKQEGKLVVMGPPSAEVREALPTAFKARFGITVEYLGGRSTESAARLRAERAAGVYAVDIVLGGSDTMATVYHAEKMLVPFKPLLILPDAVDGSKWKGGKPWFVDPEGLYVLRLFNSVSPSFHINTRYIKREELRSARDLLDPKWKGKISAHDPTVSGSGVGTATRFYLAFGEEFLKRLYVDQRPAISRDRRQLTDWLIHGKHPISLDAEEDQLERLRRDGALPIQAVYQLADMPATVSGGVGHIGFVDRAPHPNAAKVFLNWMASREGAETYARARREAPTRADIDATAFLPPEFIPQPGVKYIDIHDWVQGVGARQKVRVIMKEILKSR